MKTGSINADKYGIYQKFGNKAPMYTAMGYRGHHGLDCGPRVKLNSPIYFEEAGTITGLYLNAGSAGNMVTLRTSRKTPTVGEWRYLHLNKINGRLRVGMKVKRGDIAGYAGKTGWSNNIVHVHEDYRPFIPGTNRWLVPLNGYGGFRDPLQRTKRYRG